MRLMQNASAVIVGFSVIAMHQISGSAPTPAITTSHVHHVMGASTNMASQEVSNPMSEDANSPGQDGSMPSHSCVLEHSTCVAVTPSTIHILPALVMAKNAARLAQLSVNTWLVVRVHSHPPSRAQLSIWRM